MSLVLLVTCDSDPAPYAGGSSWPCRAYLPTSTDSGLTAQVEAVRQGWTVELTVTAGANRYRHTCPACTRALAHLARAAERPQETAT